jgi:hypothetical protein
VTSGTAPAAIVAALGRRRVGPLLGRGRLGPLREAEARPLSDGGVDLPDLLELALELVIGHLEQRPVDVRGLEGKRVEPLEPLERAQARRFGLPSGRGEQTPWRAAFTLPGCEATSVTGDTGGALCTRLRRPAAFPRIRNPLRRPRRARRDAEDR